MSVLENRASRRVANTHHPCSTCTYTTNNTCASSAACTACTASTAMTSMTKVTEQAAVAARTTSAVAVSTVSGAVAMASGPAQAMHYHRGDGQPAKGAHGMVVSGAGVHSRQLD